MKAKQQAIVARLSGKQDQANVEEGEWRIT